MVDRLNFFFDFGVLVFNLSTLIVLVLRNKFFLDLKLYNSENLSYANINSNTFLY